MLQKRKWGARVGGLRVSTDFNPEPDLDNANVGRYGHIWILCRNLCVGFLHFLCWISGFYFCARYNTAKRIIYTAADWGHHLRSLYKINAKEITLCTQH